METHKNIPHLWKRKNSFYDKKVVEIPSWQVEEKVEGLSLRIKYDTKTDQISCRSQNDYDEIPRDAFIALLFSFNLDKMKSATQDMKNKKVVLYVKFRILTDIPIFILVDVSLDDSYLNSHEKRLLASRLDINTPAMLGDMDWRESITFMASKPISYITKGPMSGIVCRSRHKNIDYSMQITKEDIKKYASDYL